MGNGNGNGNGRDFRLEVARQMPALVIFALLAFYGMQHMDELDARHHQTQTAVDELSRQRIETCHSIQHESVQVMREVAQALAQNAEVIRANTQAMRELAR